MTPSHSPATTARVVVATTVALSFISFWRGAAVVLSDLASSMFYAGGIAEQAIGKTAPWFILAIMLFSFAVRSVYMESCGMFVRGGVYVVVRDSLGPLLAKLSVSALVVDYILTGPISSVSAGHYFGRLVNDISEMLHQPLRLNPDHFAVGFGVAVTAYFWRSNIKGLHESSTKALRIMQITTVMVVVLLVWCPLTLLVRGDANLPPPPTPGNLQFSREALGWLHGTSLPEIPVIAMLVALGHSLLAMSGFETLAQIYREIAHPKVVNLRRTANIVCTYALMSTGLISLFAVLIIPDEIRRTYTDNLIGGLAMNLAGPPPLRLLFHVFVVIVGVLILSGAVNTALIGANGILNRVAEDRVLLDWFRKPHPKFGTTYRMVHLVAVLQLGTILASGGDVRLLGEAYAFGVVWSFSFKALGVLALRYQRSDQKYKVPLNLRIRGVEIPVGLGLTTVTLVLIAVANLASKPVATISGVSLTILLYVLFRISERMNARRQSTKGAVLEEFNLDHETEIDTGVLKARPGCVLVAIRDYTQMEHLRRTLQKTNLRRHDIVVMTVRVLQIAGAGEYELANEQLFSDYERELFSHVVTMAEKEGKPVDLLVVPGVDPFDAMVHAACKLNASKLVTGVSAKMSSEELARRIGMAWERLPEPRPAFSLEVISRGRPSTYVNLGPHPPQLWPEDIDRLHDLWLRLTAEEGVGYTLHHRDIVHVALERLAKDLDSPDKQEEIRTSAARGLPTAAGPSAT